MFFLKWKRNNHWQSSIIFLFLSLVGWRMAPAESGTNNVYTTSKSRCHRETFRLSVPKSCCSSLCAFHSSLFFALNLNCQHIHCKIPQISPGAYIFSKASFVAVIFRWAFIRRGLYTKGNLRFRIDWASL